MKRQTRTILFAGILILLVSACAPSATASAPAEVAVTESPADVPSDVPATGLVPEALSQYVGLKYPPIPDGLSENFALLIQGAEDHSLSLITNGQQTMLWLGRMTHRDAGGNAFWEVKDILDLSDVESGLVLLPDGCSLNGAPDGEILAVGKDAVILQTWRANTASDVFEVIPIDGIECQSDKAWPLE